MTGRRRKGGVAQVQAAVLREKRVDWPDGMLPLWGRTPCWEGDGASYPAAPQREEEQAGPRIGSGVTK